MNLKKLVLASGNLAKAKEFSAMLKPLGYELVLQKDLGIGEVEETGQSFVENALLKARYASALSGLPALADDSGLCVNALHGLPGILSARFAGSHGDDKANNLELLRRLYGIKDRSAFFFCALVLVRAADDPCPLIAQASFKGEIGLEPLGDEGFGYDPLFFVAQYNCTVAQLEPAQKNSISHRAKALAQLVELIKQDAL